MPQGTGKSLAQVLALELSGSQRVARLASLVQLPFIELFAVGVTAVLDNVVPLFLTAGIISAVVQIRLRTGSGHITACRCRVPGFW
jgi:4-amino-4-deoxy-L-arabinose transferase-like glycosyltransferase